MKHTIAFLLMLAAPGVADGRTPEPVTDLAIDVSPYTYSSTTCPESAPSPGPWCAVTYDTIYELIISWSLPTSNTDGSSLDVSELVGYEVRVIGTDSDDTYYVTGGGVSTIAGTLPPLGTYEITVTALSVEGSSAPSSSTYTVE